MKKIAILSDIHGNLAALEKVIEDINTRQVDCVFNLGDHISGPLWPKETLEYLKRQDWIQILGNHDRQLINQSPGKHNASDMYAYQQLNESELNWLRKLPTRQTFDNIFLLFHGSPESDISYLLETVEHGRQRLASKAELSTRLKDSQFPIILCGHTHVPRVVEWSPDTTIVNPGSVGLQAYEDDRPEYHIIETGSHHARYAIMELRNDDRWRSELITVPYDFRKAAEQALKNDRPEWAHALLTGYMQPRDCK